MADDEGRGYVDEEGFRMKIGIPKEVHPGERRVAQTPDTVARLLKMGFAILVESGAGEAADFDDEQYEAAGCQIIHGTRELWDQADIIVKVRGPEHHPELNCHEAELLNAGKTLISFLFPAQHEDLLKQLQARGTTVLAMDQVPRITRAQKMDALSSMANIAGYRAVIEAAENFGRFFTGQITAAGKVPPARVLVIGAGVAGLAAIGAARGLGAVVKAFDTRPAVEEQVASMGAQYVTVDFDEEGTGQGGYAKVMSEAFMDAERKLFEELARETDIIITTALIPGKPAPYLITEQALKNMKNGSVIVDLAAEQGGNCPQTVADQVTVKHGVRLVGYTDLPSRMASVASNLYGNNLAHLLDELGGAEGYAVDESNDVIRGALVIREGELKWPPPAIKDPSPPAPKPSASPAQKSASESAAAKPAAKKQSRLGWVGLVVAAVLFMLAGSVDHDGDFLSHLTVFVLACFIGWQVIWNVTPALHTPLMSVTNAISGIIVVGGMLQIGGPISSPATILGAIAICVATINIAGGFLVTQRMLKMFHR